MAKYQGLDCDDLANFRLSAIFGFPAYDSLAGRLGAALAHDTSLVSREVVRLIESEPHAETAFISSIYRGMLVDPHWLRRGTSRLVRASRVGGETVANRRYFFATRRRS